MVWVNQKISNSMVSDVVSSVGLLGAASDFMLFDTTIMAVRISHLQVSFDGNATTAIKEYAAALIVGNEQLDSTDFDSLLNTSIGAAWMWHGLVTLRTPGPSITNLNIVSNFTSGLLVKAKRRFRENNQDLFLVSEYNDGGQVDTTIIQRGFVRILIRIP